MSKDKGNRLEPIRDYDPYNPRLLLLPPAEKAKTANGTGKKDYSKWLDQMSDTAPPPKPSAKRSSKRKPRMG